MRPTMVVRNVYWHMVAVPYILAAAMITELLLQLERFGVFRGLPYGIEFSGW